MIERIIGLAIQRRWVVVTLAAIAMFLGGLALTRLPIDAVPDITNKQIQINTLAPALSPAEIEKQVTFPIETALAGAPGLESTRSLSRNGFSQITAVFREATNIYFARQQVGERLTEVRARLPQGVEPRMGPTSTGLGEVYMWSVHFSGRPAPADGAPGLQSDGRFLSADGQMLQSDVEKDAYLRTVQDWIIKPRIKMVPGVAGVDSIGGYLKQYHVYPDAPKLIALGLTFADVAKAIESNNVSRGARYIERNGEGLVVRSGGRLQNIDELGTVVVTTRGGVPIRIRDIATVSIGGETRTGSASEDGREVVVGVALMLIGANSRTVSAAVDARLRTITPSLPPGVEVTTVLDRTELVDATIGTVARNLSEGALLVIAVLFMLLGNFRAALITALVIPIAMLMTAIGMWQGRISANLMSLGALDFGLIVDGAVIITENSLRHLAEKQQALGRVLTRDERLATVHASAVEMVQPSLYGQAIILLVYVPLLTFTGVEGKMFEPMALTVILALGAAFVLSLTLVPALIAISISGRVQEEENRLVATLKGWYRPLLRRAVATPIPVIAVAVVLFATALFGFSRLGQEFIPSLDEKNIAMHALRIPSTSLSQSQAMQLSVEKTVSRFPQVSFVFSKTGTPEVASDPMPPNASDTFIMLKPREQWPDPSMTKEQLIGEISKAVGRLPGNVYEFTQPIQMRFNELLAGVRGDIAVKVFGDEFEPMQRAANQVAAALRSVRGATDVKVEQTSGLPILEIKVDKAAIARRGLSVSAVHDVIGAAVGGQDAGVVYEGDRSFDIVVRLPESVRSDLEALSNLPVALPKVTPNSPVQSLPLNRVAQFSFTEGPNQISRENGKRRIVVTANVRGRDLGSVVEEAQANVAQSVKLPPGYWMTWGGQSENLAAARQRLAVVVPACFAMIFLLLLAAMGSARDALLVFSAVPLALTGGIAALWLRDMPFSISAAVGFIALSGVAVLNGLVMLSFVRQLRERGVPLREAIEQGALTRFRPVVMTALVASLGFVPMAFATGTGAEVQKPLATVVIGGLISATLLTLAVLPALYARYGHAGSAARNERAAIQPAE
ncbi:efflux RND transporter permease subunit [Bradyrhizobium septentrionale]|uniref:CusA/CzcA family heavy metal efflux RND transporter n=1 Tax=Bradyrhizobium septentrionale TaxID=1404411 RepID=A0A973W2T5_9BRAD|nr:CusA/CzcA family heavy metal efflux RND transporter [Bradyrhizobium septentrionale]UGY15282.1 CusA/CzcA family heavy metal efflux RND transporter [Bradyrhizobium septentrionale]UGY23872.1 CusA/CzcA family heavy metal efflux RND transporter [Bradyrhizobium septentrionale]